MHTILVVVIAALFYFLSNISLYTCIFVITLIGSILNSDINLDVRMSPHTVVSPMECVHGLTLQI